MAVPAHDTRDFEFAEKFGLPIVCIQDPDVTDTGTEKQDHCMVKSAGLKTGNISTHPIREPELISMV